MNKKTTLIYNKLLEILHTEFTLNIYSDGKNSYIYRPDGEKYHSHNKVVYVPDLVNNDHNLRN